MKTYNQHTEEIVFLKDYLKKKKIPYLIDSDGYLTDIKIVPLRRLFYANGKIISGMCAALLSKYIKQ